MNCAALRPLPPKWENARPSCDSPPLIQFRQLTLTRGVRRLIEDASLQIHAGWRVGVVGANIEDQLRPLADAARGQDRLEGAAVGDVDLDAMTQRLRVLVERRHEEMGAEADAHGRSPGHKMTAVFTVGLMPWPKHFSPTTFGPL